MSNFDELVDRLTHKLRIDPELRLDVANELRSHLEDSAEEFKKAGYSDSDARANAVKALGDETELAHNLWLANRRRLQFRQVVKWTARAALVPASFILIFFLLIVPARTIMLSLHMAAISHSLEDRITTPARSLPEEDRWIILGDPEARDNVEKEKSIAERWPDNPVYYGNYVNMALTKMQVGSQKNLELLPLLEKGRQLEPENAFYDIMIAAILIDAAGELQEDPDLAIENLFNKPYRITVTDPERFQQGIEALREGIEKPNYNSHALDMARLRISLLPPLRNVNDYVVRQGVALNVLLPDLSPARNLSNALGAYAFQLARQGQREQAEELFELIAILGGKIADQSEFLINFLVGYLINNIPLEYGIYAYQALELPQESERARLQRRENQELFNSIRHSREAEDFNQKLTRYGGAIDHTFAFAGIIQWDFSTARQLDYVIFGRLGTGFLFLILTGISLIALAITGINLLRFRNNPRGPLLYFVGWRDLAKIILFAVLIPIAIYTLYLYILPPYSVRYAAYRLIPEYILLTGIIVVLTLILSYAAIRRRLMEAGIVIPDPITWKKRRGSLILAGVSIIAILGLIITWHVHNDAIPYITESGRFNSITSLMVIFVSFAFIGWLGRELVYLFRLPDSYARFRRTFFRSLAPILMLVVIITSLGLGYLLSARERTIARQLSIWGFHDQVEITSFHTLRDRLREEYRINLANYRQRNIDH